MRPKSILSSENNTSVPCGANNKILTLTASTPYLSNKSRWSIIATMGMWWVMPSMDIIRSIDNNIYKSCSNMQKQLLGFCSIPPINEFERNNTKCGYDFLKKNISDY